MTVASIGGFAAPGFELVRDAFVDNFSRDDGEPEIGAAVAVYHRGECVADLWGGHADRACSRPWARDTLINVWSATKGVVALAVAILVDQGRLRYQDKVATHWPEFAEGGKSEITVAQMMSHQAGLNGFSEPTTIADFQDPVRLASRLAAQTPFWPPGSLASYHAVTYGILAGELVRRVSGQDVGGFIRDTIAAPLGAEFYLGLPAGLEWRVGEIVGPAISGVAAMELPVIPARAVANPRLAPESPNNRAWRAAQMPALNGQAAAQGLGRIYGALANGGTLDGATVISPDGIAQLRAPRYPGPDLMLGPRQWAAGMSFDVAPIFGPHAETFGHTGWGGAFGCANVERRVGIGYVMNRMGGRVVGNPRGAALCAAVFACVDG
jgi:CubicO group peptidase (beta-lactamase class C family)